LKQFETPHRTGRLTVLGQPVNPLVGDKELEVGLPVIQQMVKLKFFSHTIPL